MEIKFCCRCGSALKKLIPADDDHQRDVCTSCSHIHYLNPKMVVGTIPVFEDKILLCKRDIEPMRGKWTLPAGYLENGESVQDGAARETLEETRAKVKIIEPYRLFNILFVDQVYMMFRADLPYLNYGPTSESSDVRLFAEKDIPWDKIAFDVISQTLKDFFNDRAKVNGSDSKTAKASAPYPFMVKDIAFSKKGLKAH